MDQESLQRCGQWHMARPMTGRAPHASFVVKEVYLLRFSSFSFCQPFPVVLNPFFSPLNPTLALTRPTSAVPPAAMQRFTDSSLSVNLSREVLSRSSALWVHRPLQKHHILPWFFFSKLTTTFLMLSYSERDSTGNATLKINLLD